MIEVKDVFQQIMYIVITAILPIALSYFKKFIDAKMQEIFTEIKNESTAKYLTYAYNSVGYAVDYVSQTYVDSLKKSGSFDEEAQAKAKDEAKKIALSLITEEAKDAIELIYGDINTYLSTSIESYLRTSKVNG